jgi:hypothetical protein
MAFGRGPLELRRVSSRLGASVVNRPLESPDGPGIGVEGIDVKSFVEQHVNGPISLIKMDIEGAEVEALDALSEEFLITIPQISVEFHDFCNTTPIQVVGRIVERLKALGFCYLRMSGIGHQDTLFVNRRLAAFGRSDEIVTRIVSRNIRGMTRVVRRRLGLAPRC